MCVTGTKTHTYYTHKNKYDHIINIYIYINKFYLFLLFTVYSPKHDDSSEYAKGQKYAGYTEITNAEHTQTNTISSITL